VKKFWKLSIVTTLLIILLTPAAFGVTTSSTEPTTKTAHTTNKPEILSMLAEGSLEIDKNILTTIFMAAMFVAAIGCITIIAISIRKREAIKKEVLELVNSITNEIDQIERLSLSESMRTNIDAQKQALEKTVDLTSDAEVVWTRVRDSLLDIQTNIQSIKTALKVDKSVKTGL
jgi:hypothetical protein